ncbi:hypothetical protein B4Q13_24155, partial [Lacticaseibacillus rhamnosus]
AWLAFDMGHPLAQLTMPMSPQWSAANLLAIVAMWAVMMAAMMLPSALPMVQAFVALCRRNGQRARSRQFVGAYLLVWLIFSVAATAAQWLLQAVGWVNPMIVSTSERAEDAASITMSSSSPSSLPRRRSTAHWIHSW